MRGEGIHQSDGVQLGCTWKIADRSAFNTVTENTVWLRSGGWAVWNSWMGRRHYDNRADSVSLILASCVCCGCVVLFDVGSLAAFLEIAADDPADNYNRNGRAHCGGNVHPNHSRVCTSTWRRIRDGGVDDDWRIVIKQIRSRRNASYDIQFSTCFNEKPGGTLPPATIAALTGDGAESQTIVGTYIVDSIGLETALANVGKLYSSSRGNASRNGAMLMILRSWIYERDAPSMSRGHPRGYRGNGEMEEVRSKPVEADTSILERS